MRHLEFDKLILHDAAVHTMDDAGTPADAVGFSGGHVTAVGSLDEVRRATPGAEERALGGAPIYPGFVDTHHHLCFAATYENFPEIRTPPHRDVSDILATVARCAERVPEGTWIVLVGFDELQLRERRKPTRFEIDRVAPRHPVLLTQFSYHEGVLNSLGLGRCGFDRLREDPPGGALGRTRSGELDGIVLERCFGHAEAVARNALLASSRDGWFEGANLYQDRVLAAGITHVCDAAVPPSMESLYREWHARGDLHVGVTMMPLVENMFAVPEQRLDGPATGWSDGRLSIGPLKLFTDGGIRCALCLTLRDAISQFGVLLSKLLSERRSLGWQLVRRQKAVLGRDRKLHMGLLYYDAEQLTRIVREACARGFSVGIHAEGNEAIAQATAALARAYRGALPPRIDHFFFLEEGSLRAAVREGIHIVVQPVQLRDTGDLVLQTGLPPRLGYLSFRSMLDAGATVAGSSDAPVFTFSVAAAIESAVRRRVASGAVHDRHQSLTVAEALRLYTRGAAATLGMEGQIGVLRPGARADAVALSESPERIPVERLGEIGVRAAFAGRMELRP
jgi:predicted amidohydrolase YtcJ